MLGVALVWASACGGHATGQAAGGGAAGGGAAGGGAAGGQAGHEVAGVAYGVVYGADDRHEFYEVQDPVLRGRMAHGGAVLMHREAAAWVVRASQGGVLQGRAGSAASSCAPLPFAEQPVLAFCSAVLLEDDLVLTAAHCAEALPLDELMVVFGFYYEAPGRLAVRPQDVLPVAEVVASDHAGSDYAWLRLGYGAPEGRGPIPVYTAPAASGPFAALTMMSATEGLPMKVDAGAYWFESMTSPSSGFVANTDTFQGSSGGPALNGDLGVVGILTEGVVDYEWTEDGCRHLKILPDLPAFERFTSSVEAVAGLCAVADSALCAMDCAQPCTTVGQVAARSGAGCSVGLAAEGRRRRGLGVWGVLCATAWLLVLGRPRAGGGLGRQA